MLSQARAHKLAMEVSTLLSTMPSLPVTRELSSAIRTDLNAELAEVETFIAQLFEAPSQIIPATSPIMLQMAMLTAPKPPRSSQAMPAAAPMAAVVTAQSAESLGNLL